MTVGVIQYRSRIGSIFQQRWRGGLQRGFERGLASGQVEADARANMLDVPVASLS